MGKLSAISLSSSSAPCSPAPSSPAPSSSNGPRPVSAASNGVPVPGVAPPTQYQAAEQRMRVPPVAERGRKNENPSELSFWELLKEDFVTHESSLFEQGFWAVANNRFGNWRMDVKNPVLRAPCTVAYRALEKGIEIFGGITLPYTTKLGRRVRLWHHGG